MTKILVEIATVDRVLEALEDPAILNGVNNAKFLIKQVLALAEQPTEKEKISRGMTAEFVAMRALAQQEPVANASSWFALIMCAAAEIEDASNCLRDEDAKRVAICGAKYYRDAANALYTSPPAQPDYQAMESALTRLQKRYADLEGKARSLEREHLVIDRRTGRYTDAARYFDLIEEAALRARGNP